MIKKRKTPVRHTVRAHTRSGTPVKSFKRGTGEPTPTLRRKSIVVGSPEIVIRDLLTGTTRIVPVTPPKHGEAELPVRLLGSPGIDLPPGYRPFVMEPPPGDWKPIEPPPLPEPLPLPPTRRQPPSPGVEFPPDYRPFKAEPPPGDWKPIEPPTPIPAPPGALELPRGGGWVQYDVKTGGVTTYIPGGPGQPGIVTHTLDPSKRVPFDPDVKWEPIPMPTLPPGYRTPMRYRHLTAEQVVRSSNQLLTRYKRAKLVPERIAIFNQLKALSDEHMRLTGRPTTVHNIQSADLFTKKQLEEYRRQLRRRREKRR